MQAHVTKAVNRQLSNDENSQTQHNTVFKAKRAAEQLVPLDDAGSLQDDADSGIPTYGAIPLLEGEELEDYGDGYDKTADMDTQTDIIDAAPLALEQEHTLLSAHDATSAPENHTSDPILEESCNEPILLDSDHSDQWHLVAAEEATAIGQEDTAGRVADLQNTAAVGHKEWAPLSFVPPPLDEQGMCTFQGLCMCMEVNVHVCLWMSVALSYVHDVTDLPEEVLSEDLEWLFDPQWEALRTQAAEAGWLIHPQELQLGAQIGAGAFGTTYSAVWRGNTVAVKCVTVHGDAAARMFMREVSLLVTVQHPNVLRCFGTGFTFLYSG